MCFDPLWVDGAGEGLRLHPLLPEDSYELAAIVAEVKARALVLRAA